MTVNARTVLLAMRNKAVTLEMTHRQGVDLFTAWNAIDNKEAAQAAYEDHVRAMAVEALRKVGVDTEHRDLDKIANEILAVFDLRPSETIGSKDDQNDYTAALYPCCG